MNQPISRGAGGPVASTFCLGTIAWGTNLVGDELDRLYDTFRNAGGNFFDSAHVYAFWRPNGTGASERALGQLVRRRNDSDNVILATKGGHPHMDGGYPRPPQYLSPEVIAADIRDSLERLGVATIDLYFLHRDDPRVPVDEIIDVLNEHVARRHLRQLGASNWMTSRIAAANEYARTTGKSGFVTSQVKFSLGVPRPSKDPTVPTFGPDDLRWHEQTGLSVCAYSPTANGYFATNGVKAAKGWEAVTRARLREANRLADELRATPNQIALAYLLHQQFRVIPILGTTNVAHLTDALGSDRVKLTTQQLQSLSAGQAFKAEA